MTGRPPPPQQPIGGRARSRGPGGPAASGQRPSGPMRSPAPGQRPPARPPTPTGGPMRPHGVPSPGPSPQMKSPPPPSQSPSVRTPQPVSQQRPSLEKAGKRDNLGPPPCAGRAKGRDDLSSQMSSVSLSGRSGSGASGTGEVAGRGVAGRGVFRGHREPGTIMMTRPSSLATKSGSHGVTFQCATNYFRIIQAPNWNLYQYRVDFSPDVDALMIRKVLVRQHSEKFGSYLFDGSMLFTIQRYTANGEKLILMSHLKESTEPTQVTLKLVGEVQPTDYHHLQFCNILLRRCLETLNLTMVGRNFYDPGARVLLKEYKLELWPGYETSIRQHENGLLLCCEISNKILRADTVLDQIREMATRNPRTFRDDAVRNLTSCIVLTRYNNKTYKIDDIIWTENPKLEFKHKGESISIAAYYKERYKITVKDMGQPLILSNPTARQRRDGITEPIKLVPELCYMTGLSDEQRANFKLMKAVGEYTRTAPPQRVASLMKFSERLRKTKESVEEMGKWNLKLNPQLEQFKARTLEPEKILQGRGRSCSYPVDNADWGRELRSLQLFGAISCSKWMVLVPKQLSGETNEFVQLLMKTSQPMGFMLGNPKPIVMDNDRPSSYSQKLNEVLPMGPQMIMAVIPNNRSTAYSEIKKVCCVSNPVPSQVITGTLLKKPKGLMSVASKVAVQMASKLGAEPWAVDIPATGLMVIGYDSWHDTSQKGMSVGAVVSTYNKHLTKTTSSIALHKNNEELLNKLGGCFVKAVRKYMAHNGNEFPRKIIVYRDGVGDGQINQVKEQEVEMVKENMKRMNFTASLTYIIVSKRIRSRFFRVVNGNTPPGNPPSGSVIDDIVTLPERYDFYLISQSVNQGTVNPTSYNIIEDNSGWSPDILQRLSYKLCHLYYNWTGTVRVPSVCQYAHKLAYLVGESIHSVPHEKLDDLPYYL